MWNWQWCTCILEAEYKSLWQGMSVPWRWCSECFHHKGRRTAPQAKVLYLFEGYDDPTCLTLVRDMYLMRQLWQFLPSPDALNCFDTLSLCCNAIQCYTAEWISKGVTGNLIQVLSVKILTVILVVVFWAFQDPGCHWFSHNLVF